VREREVEVTGLPNLDTARTGRFIRMPADEPPGDEVPMGRPPVHLVSALGPSSRQAGKREPGLIRVPTLRFDAAGRTNGGTIGENADGYIVHDRMLALADGVAFADTGPRASALALGTVVVDRPHADDDPIQGLRDCVDHANQTLYQVGQDVETLAGMSTALDVVTLCRLAGDWALAFAHVGNATVCVFPEPDAECGQVLTTPHSFGRGPLLRAVGSDLAVVPDIGTIAVQPGAIVVMASDGLTDVLRFSDILAVVQWHASDPPYECADALLREAYERRTSDSTTVVVAHVREAEGYIRLDPYG
jgi:serine/threonine protein phosphatase PrpC